MRDPGLIFRTTSSYAGLQILLIVFLVASGTEIGQLAPDSPFDLTHATHYYQLPGDPVVEINRRVAI